MHATISFPRYAKRPLLLWHAQLSVPQVLVKHTAPNAGHGSRGSLTRYRAQASQEPWVVQRARWRSRSRSRRGERRAAGQMPPHRLSAPGSGAGSGWCSGYSLGARGVGPSRRVSLSEIIQHQLRAEAGALLIDLDVEAAELNLQLGRTSASGSPAGRLPCTVHAGNPSARHGDCSQYRIHCTTNLLSIAHDHDIPLSI